MVHLLTTKVSADSVLKIWTVYLQDITRDLKPGRSIVPHGRRRTLGDKNSDYQGEKISQENCRLLEKNREKCHVFVLHDYLWKRDRRLVHHVVKAVFVVHRLPMSLHNPN